MSILQVLRAGAVASSVCLLLSCGGDGNDVPKTSLVRVDDEPAGANCANGGIAIISGIDGNKNGVLDDNEVLASQTRYVCAPSGAPAPAVVAAIDTNVSSNDCRYGGNRVRSGLDTNGNGVLDDNEATSTTFACNPPGLSAVIFGDVSIATTDDLSQLDGITVIAGQLSVNVKNDVTIPGIETVGSNIYVDVGTTADVDSTLSMPALTSAGGIGFASGTLDAPQLRHVSGNVGYQGGGLFGGPTVNVSLPALETAGSVGFAPFIASASLQTLHLPALKTTQAISIVAPSITAVDVPSLAKLGSLFINGGALTELNLPALTSVDSLTVENIATLTALTAPLLTSIGTTLTIAGNPLLSGCAPLAIEVNTIPSGKRYDVNVGSNGAGCTTNTAETCGAITIDGAASSFHLCLVRADEADGDAACASIFGGHLASFASADQETKVKAALAFDAWIGFTDAGDEGNWTWTDGTTAYLPETTDTTFWAPTEPNGGTSENCAIMASGGGVDTSCTDQFPVLCLAP